MSGITRRAALFAAGGAGMLGPFAARGLDLSGAAEGVKSDTHDPRIDALFARYARHDAPGLSVGVFQAGRARHVGYYGAADLEQGVAIGPRSLFSLASVSKQFTAFAIALLVREGRVDVEADVRDYLPYFPRFAHPVRVSHLIHHTSGLRDQWMLMELAGCDPRGVMTQQRILDVIARQRELNFRPGAEYLYSNTNYTLLAEIVAARAGMPFRRFCAERIFQPLGMSRTFVADDIEEIIPERVPTYESRGEGRWRKSIAELQAYGANNVYSNVVDLGRWLENFERPRIGDAALIATLTAPATLNDGKPLEYGYGLIRTSFLENRAWMHFGNRGGICTAVAHFPETKLSVVLLGNQRFDRVRLIEAIVSLVMEGRAMQPARELPPPPQAFEAVGRYLDPHGTLVSIERSGQDLIWKTPGDAGKKLVFHADGSFDLSKPHDDFFRFRREGAALTIEAIAPEAPLSAVSMLPVELASPTAQELARFAGRYRMPEIDREFICAVEDGRLSLRPSMWSQGLTFVPSIADRFDHVGGMLSIGFVRAPDGAVVGARVDASRCRGLWLERLPQENASA